MPSPPKKEVAPAPAAETLTASVLGDRWLFAVLLITAALYVTLIFLRPTGENWGRGWNMVAFLIYSTPTALIAGVVALWRLGRNSGRTRKLAGLAASAALVFPIVCMVAIRLKA